LIFSREKEQPMNRQILKAFVFFLWMPALFTFHYNLLLAQKTFTVEQCVKYAFENNPLLRASATDTSIAAIGIKRVGGQYLPRVNIGAAYQYYIANRSIVVEGGTPLAPTDLEESVPLSVDVGYANSFFPSLVANQRIFDPSYKSSYNIALSSQQLTVQQLYLFRIDVIEGIHKAFYSCKILELQEKFLRENITRIDTLVELTRIKYERGAGVRLEVNRVEITGNRMKSELANVMNSYSEALAALQFQMNYLEADSMILLSDITQEQLQSDARSIMAQLLQSSPAFRLESQLLQTQLTIADESVKLEQSRALPFVGAEGALGFAPGANQFDQLFQSERWMPYSYVGVSVGIPIFNGLDVRRAVDQRTLVASQSREYMLQFNSQFKSEKGITSAAISNSLERLDFAFKNLKLAEDNVALLDEAFVNGLADNQDLILGENDLYDNQVRYFSELIELMINQVEGRQVSGDFNQMASN
jgi:outer membrane protein TolC